MKGNSSAEQLSLFSVDRALPLLLFSLRPDWHVRFTEGSKSFEYRRRFIQRPFCAAVYVSGSTRAIAAFAEFGDAIVGRPDEIAELAEVSDGVSSPALIEYFGHNAQAIALPVVSYRPMPFLSLASIRRALPGFQPPQSYTYLDKNTALLDFIGSQPQWSAVLEPWKQ